MTSRSWVGLVLAAVVISGRAHAQAAEVRDSDGIRLVTVPSFVLSGPTTPLGRTQVDLGGLHDTAALEFDSRNPTLGGVMLGDGRIVVADDVHLKYFNRRGTLLNMAGRAGGGPAEFRQISQLCDVGNGKVLAFEANGNRVTLFDSTGKLIRTIPVPGISAGSGCFSDGTFLFRPWKQPEGMASVDPRSSYSHMTLSGVVEDGPGRMVTGPPEYGIPAVTIGVIIAATKIYVADPGQGEVRRYELNGHLDEIIRARARPERFTDQDVKREIEKLVPGGARANPTLARELGDEPHRAYWPSFAQLLVDATGRLWIEDYFNRNPRGWNVFDSLGNPLGRVPIDSLDGGRAEIVGVGSQSVVVRWFDDNGSPHLTWRAWPRLPGVQNDGH